MYFFSSRANLEKASEFGQADAPCDARSAGTSAGEAAGDGGERAFHRVKDDHEQAEGLAR
jgi:hypothetical protein